MFGRIQWRSWYLVPLSLVVLGIGAAVALVVVSAFRPLTQLEESLFQVLSLGLSIAGSFWFGLAATAGSPPPTARSAFRRVLSVYQGLGRISQAIGDRRIRLRALASASGTVELSHIEDALGLLDAQVTEQISTVNDAVEDWRDLAPDEVALLDKQAAARDSALTGEAQA